jgi:hypothetical protein
MARLIAKVFVLVILLAGVALASEGMIRVHGLHFIPGT